MKIKKILIGTLFVLYVHGLFAQVTIGQEKEPEVFSALELISNQQRGLRLPQMTTSERQELTETTEFQEKKEDLAKGLMIYNTDIHCIEYWNGGDWVNLCEEIISPSKVNFDPIYNTYQTGDTRLYVNAIFAKGAGDDYTRGTGIEYEEMSGGYFRYKDASGQEIAEILEFPHASGLTVIVYPVELTSKAGGGRGTIEVKVKGTPSEAYAGKAFDIPINLFETDLIVRVNTGCGSYIGNRYLTDADGVATQWLQFQCFNLGGVPNGDPFTPVQSIHGHKYIWGQKEPVLTQTQDQSTPGAIANWIEDNAFVDVTTWPAENNPCGEGWRLPTMAELRDMAWYSDNAYKYISTTGNWEAGIDNYDNGAFYGPALMIPAAGYRNYNTGQLVERGIKGAIWSSQARRNTSLEVSDINYYRNYHMESSLLNGTPMGYWHFFRTSVSVRCVKDN